MSAAANMPLFVRTQGQGPVIALIHGWGLHGGVWDGLVPLLTEHAEVVVPDLPGFGRSRELPDDYDLGALVDALIGAVPAGAVWVGWSLGGLVALAAAMARGDYMRALVLVGATPRFVNGAGWTHGLEPQVLNGFVAELEQDYRATLQRFLALQGARGEGGRELVRRLRRELLRYGEPAPQALRGGLDILRTTDLRARLDAVDIPVRMVHGARDQLVSAAAAAYLADTLPRGSLELIPGAGHAPFLSHAEQFTRALTDLLLAANVNS